MYPPSVLLFSVSQPNAGFSGAARTHASHVAGNAMEGMLSPRPLQAIVRRGIRQDDYFAYSILI
jgi:hypothetical protein